MAERRRFVVKGLELLDEADVSVGEVLGNAASVDIGVEVAGEDDLLSSSTPGTKGSAEVSVKELQRIAVIPPDSPKVSVLLVPDRSCAVASSSPSTRALFVGLIYDHNPH